MMFLCAVWLYHCRYSTCPTASRGTLWRLSLATTNRCLLLFTWFQLVCANYLSRMLLVQPDSLYMEPADQCALVSKCTKS